MSVSASIPPTVQIRRNSLLGLLGLAAAFAAAVTWVVLAFGVDMGGGQAQATVPEQPAVVSSPIPMTGYLDAITFRPTVVPQAGPTRAEIFSSLSPQTRRYVQALMGLTHEQLAAGAAGSP